MAGGRFDFWRCTSKPSFSSPQLTSSIWKVSSAIALNG
jgi:hypothetical protein